MRISEFFKSFRQEKKLDDLLEEVTLKSRELVNAYSHGNYQKIPFSFFYNLDMNVPVQIEKGITATLVERVNDHELTIIINYDEGSTLEYHRHPDMVQTIEHLKGKLSLFLKPRLSTQNCTELTYNHFRCIVGKEYHIGPETYHKMIADSAAIHRVTMQKIIDYDDEK